MIHGSKPSKDNGFSSSPQNVQTGPGAHPASYSMDTRVPSRWVNRPGRKLDHSRPSSAEVKNEWCHTSTLPLRLHGVPREKLPPLLFLPFT